MNKSQSAFILSADKMFENCSQVYFWTFTLKEVLCDWEAIQCWNWFWRDFTNQMGKRFWGLRVAEYHTSHGVHFHVLLNKRVWAPEVRRIAQRYGFGRINVKARYKDQSGKWHRIDKGAGRYLAKYLGKGKSMKIRKWAAIGKGWAVRSNDIVGDDEWKTTKVLMYGQRKISGCEAAQVSRNLAKSKTYSFKRLKKYDNNDVHVLHPMSSYDHEKALQHEKTLSGAAAIARHCARSEATGNAGKWGNGLQPDWRTDSSLGSARRERARLAREGQGGIGKGKGGHRRMV